MDYKEKYEQLEKFIKDLYPHMSDYCKEKTEGMIPELKESEDELMKKEAISIIKQYSIICERECDKCYTADRVIAWLEKQGEQKPAWSEEDEEIIKGLNNCIDELEEKNGWRFTYVNDKDIELNKIRNWLKSLKQRLKV